MRVLFYTHCAIAATIAHLSKAIKIEDSSAEMRFDNFSQIDALNPFPTTTQTVMN